MGREEKAKEEQKVAGGKSMERESGDERRKRQREGGKGQTDRSQGQCEARVFTRVTMAKKM